MPTVQVEPGSEELQTVATALLKARKIVVVTGAGISTNSGIPDFRSENGLYSLIQAQFDAVARQPNSQGDQSQSGTDTTEAESERDFQDGPGPKRRKLSNDSITLLDHGKLGINSTGELSLPCEAVAEASEHDDTKIDALGLPILSDDTIAVCTPRPLRARAATDSPTTSPLSPPLASPLLEAFINPPAVLARVPTRHSLRLRGNRPFSVPTTPILPLSSSPLSSPPPNPFEPGPPSSPSNTSSSRRSSTSHCEMDDTALSNPLSSSQNSTRNALPNMKGKDLFDASIWADPLRTSVFYTFATSLRQKIKDCEPTSSHRFISHLRDRKKLVRCYTQNIDRIEEKVGLSTSLEDGPGGRGRFSRRSTATNSQLSKMVEEASADVSTASIEQGSQSASQNQTDESDTNKTPTTESEVLGDQPKLPPKLEASRSSGVECVFLHGSLESLRCFLCGRSVGWDGDREMATMSGHQPECPHCLGATAAREERGKRALGIGKLRPDIVLYGEEHPNAHLISPIVTHDLALCPDMLLILGTSLRVHGLKVMVREFAKSIHSRGGTVVFVNFTKPPESSWGDVIDYWVQWDCDAWVSDLQSRVPKLWEAPEEPKEKPPAKNPVALRDTKVTGAYWTRKIVDELHRITGSSSSPPSTPGQTSSEAEAKTVELSITVQSSAEAAGQVSPAESVVEEAISVLTKVEPPSSPLPYVIASESVIKVAAKPPVVTAKPTVAEKVLRPRARRSRKSAPGVLERADKKKKKPPSTLNPNHGRASKADTAPSSPVTETDNRGTILVMPLGVPDFNGSSILNSVKSNPRLRKRKKIDGEEVILPSSGSKIRKSESELTLAPLREMEMNAPEYKDMRPQPIEPKSPPEGPSSRLRVNLRESRSRSMKMRAAIDDGQIQAKVTQGQLDLQYPWKTSSGMERVQYEKHWYESEKDAARTLLDISGQQPNLARDLARWGETWEAGPRTRQGR